MENPYIPAPSASQLPTPPPARPPVIHKVVGGVILAFGGIGLFTLIISAVLYLTPLENQTGMMADLFRADPLVATSMRILVIPGVIVAIVQVVAGIGLFSSREWARKAAICTAIYGIIVGAYSGWLNFTHMLPYTMEFAMRNAPHMADPQFEGMMRTMMKASALGSAAFTIIYPVIVVILLTRPRVRVHCIASSAKPPPLIAAA